MLRLLIVNAGSSSLKLSVLDGDDELVASEEVDAPGGRADDKAVKDFVSGHGPIEAVGHRIVHGGTEFSGPVRVDPSVRHQLELLTDLAPLHQPKSLEALDVVSQILVGVPAVACFDTAFHAAMPLAAATYALPRQWRRRWNLRRFGFHGLSHSYASRRTRQLMREQSTGLSVPNGGADRIVTCHLGAGASLAAVRGGVSVDTTMGFTPLEGLVMATRSGSVDPGLLLWLEEHVGIPPSEVAATLEQRSGLLGLSGSADMRAVLASEKAEDPDAVLAMGVYLHRLRASIASMAAAMEGVDAVVFTGGVGERSAEVRQRAADGLGFLGLRLDAAANDEAEPDHEIGAAGAPVRMFVIAAREDLEIARGVRQVLEGRPS
jgi:acetate kinase